MIDHIYNTDTWNIKKQVTRCIIFLKRKQRIKLKMKECTKGCYHRLFNHVLDSSSDFVQSNTHKGYCVLDTTNHNYKLRSVIGRKEDSKATKCGWFNKQLRNTCLCSWMIPRVLVDYTVIERVIGCILNKVYVPFISMRDNIGSITSIFNISMVLHLESEDHIHIHEFIHEGLLSSSSKKQ